MFRIKYVVDTTTEKVSVFQAVTDVTNDVTEFVLEYNKLKSFCDMMNKSTALSGLSIDIKYGDVYVTEFNMRCLGVKVSSVSVRGLKLLSNVIIKDQAADNMYEFCKIIAENILEYSKTELHCTNTDTVSVLLQDIDTYRSGLNLTNKLKERTDGDN